MAWVRKKSAVFRIGAGLFLGGHLLWLFCAAARCTAGEFDPEPAGGSEISAMPSEEKTLDRSALPKPRSYGYHTAPHRKSSAGQQGVELKTEPIWDEAELDATPTPLRNRNQNRLPGVRAKAYGGAAQAPGRTSPHPQEKAAAVPGGEWITEPLTGEDAEASEAVQVVDYRAQTDRSRVHLDESFTLTLEVVGKNLEQIGSWTVPALPGFDIINVQDSGGNLTLDGRMLQIRRKRYVLLPLKTGTLAIPPLRLQAGGKQFTARVNAINVEGPRTGFAYQRQFGMSGRQQPKILPAAPDMVKNTESATEFEAFLDRPRAWVNQQVVLSIRLRYQGADDMKVTYSPPLLTGFVCEELPQTQTEERISSTRQRLIERTYRTALFPIHAGSMTIGSARVSISALNTSREWYTEAVSLEVADLPPDPSVRASAEPSALVGKYRLSAELKAGSLEMDAPVRLALWLTGTGRVAAAPDPRLPESKGYFLQLAGRTDKVTRQDQIIKGTRRYEYFLVPRKTGRIQIPPMGIRYFDPESARWRTAAVSFPEIMVRPQPRTVAISALPPQPARERVRLRSNHGGSTDLLRHDRPLVARPAFWLLHGAGLACLLLAWVWRRFRPAEGDAQNLRARKAYRTAQAALRSAQHHLRRRAVAEFYAVVSRTTAEYLSAKFGLPAAYITADRLQDYFAEYQVPGIFLTHFRIVLTACEYVRYAAVELPEHDMRSLYRDLDTTLYHFEKFWRKQSARTRAKSAAPLVMLVLAAAIVCFHGNPAAAGEAEIHFTRGNEYARNQNYTQALSEYEKVIALGANDAEVYYNLGNTYVQAGQTGKAVLAYERGLLLAPRSPDLRYNLKQAQKWVAASPWILSVPQGGIWALYAVFTVEELAWTAALAFFTGLIFLGMGWFAPKRAKVWRRAAVVTMSLWLLSLAWSAARFFEPRWLRRAVVIAPAAEVLTRPAQGADKLFTLTGGTYVLLGEEEEEWAGVKLKGRRQGWVLRSAVAKIE